MSGALRSIRARAAICVALGAFCAAGATTAPAVAEAPPPGAAILQELKSFREMGSVLMVAAHPDDENTQLLAYLARGRDVRTGYLSITRGDGGQNLLGPEFGAELGAIRTQELLAARGIDGAQQFFTRAIDFGFSKSVDDTLRVWNEGGDQKVLADVVRVIRTFRPDVIVTRFSTQASNTHGHHTASAVLALEAFKEAGDEKAFPEQLATLKVWKAKRIFMNRGGGGGAGGGVQMDVGGTDPVSGSGFGMVAGHSRSMHKTQGFGNAGRASGAWGSGPRMESFQLLDGEPAGKDILDGVDTTWNRVAGGAEIGRLADGVIAGFDVANPNASMGALMELRGHLAALPADSIVDEKRRLLDRIVQRCAGITVETTVKQAEVVPGEMLALHQEVKIAGPEQIRWVGVRYPSVSRAVGAVSDSTQTLPATTPVSQPYWLREERTKGVFRVDDAGLIGRPENLPVFPVEYLVELRGQTLVIPDEPVQVIAEAGKAEVRRRLDVIPPVTLAYPFGVRLFSPGGTKRVDVELTAYRKGTGGTLRLDVPAGWRAMPEEQKFELAAVGEKKTLSFDVSAPKEAGTGDILAKAVVDGVTYSNERVVIDYPHIPRILLQPAARLRVVDLDLAIRGKEVGYLAGAGDSVAASLEQMGYSVTQISGADLTAEGLKKFDAVVVGIRAFNVRQDLAAHVQGLFDYAAAGGTVVVQYNTPGGVQAALAPYSLKLSGDLPHNRVTDENSPVTLLSPEHPVFNTPNKIGSADFEGWVQERGLNFPSDWDSAHFDALLACGDPGETPLKSGLLVAKDGKGYFVYTGLAFFRQLPAGVPGAYRLFANLVSLGK